MIITIGLVNIYIITKHSYKIYLVLNSLLYPNFTEISLIFSVRTEGNIWTLHGAVRNRKLHLISKLPIWPLSLELWLSLPRERSLVGDSYQQDGGANRSLQTFRPTSLQKVVTTIQTQVEVTPSSQCPGGTWSNQYPCDPPAGIRRKWKRYPRLTIVY